MKTYFSQMTFVQCETRPLKEYYKNHSMIKIYEVSRYFSACFCRGLLGNFLLQQDETKLLNDFYTCKNELLKRKKHTILIQKPKTLGTTHTR